MKNRFSLMPLACLLLALVVLFSSWPWFAEAQGRSGDQQMAQLRFLSVGPSTQGANALQVGEVSTLSAAVATATLTEVVAAPTTGSIYLRGIWIEKSTTATGSVLVRYGTGTNCATGTTTLLSLTAAASQTFAFGYYPIGVPVPATKALCLGTDASTTGVRALTN